MNIVVTGASRGIGFQLVKVFAKFNHTIVAIARNKEKLDLLKAECLKEYPHSLVHIVVFDLAQMDSTLDLRKMILDVLPSVDILVNNAGLLINKPFQELTTQDFLETYSVNFFAIAALINALLPYMGKETIAHIVNISSMGGMQGSAKFPGLSAYSSSKSALNCLTEMLAVELEDLNIKVNSLALGAVQTEMLAEAFPNYRAQMTAEEMAEYIAHFSLTGHNYFNGKIIPVSSSTP